MELFSIRIQRTFQLVSTADNRIRFITLIVLECLSAANVADGKPPGRVKLLLKYYGGVIPGYPNPFLYLL